MRRAKIVATLGPASRSPEMIQTLVNAGMNIARLNFSHGSHDDHRATYEGVRRADLSLDALGGPAQKQLRQLFDLVQWSAFRRLAGGVARPWEQAGVDDMQTLLTHFRDSRLALLNGAYRALVKIGSVTIWSQPAMFDASHYPGPPAWAVTALNA